MANIVTVDDPGDPRLVEVAGLTDAQSRNRTEAEHGCFVVEGLRTLETAVHSSYELRLVLCAESKLDRVLDTVGGLDIDVHIGSLDLLEAVAGFPIHRGVVASAARRPLPEVDAVVDGTRRVVVVEGLNDHENLGALFRNAAGFGVDAVLIDPTTADPLYRRSVRVSLGHVLDVPWTRIGALPDALAGLHDRGFETVALTPSGDVAMAAVAGAERLAWLVGAEGPGLTDETLGATTHRVAIPMAPGVDSLNAATAAAVAFALDASAGG
ncbi:MAG: RNA methyltransferase [Acidimicrobiales bacterium]|nr:RNA methyltransferase [Acidimicrobiales bacterium]